MRKECSVEEGRGQKSHADFPWVHEFTTNSFCKIGLDAYSKLENQNANVAFVANNFIKF